MSQINSLYPYWGQYGWGQNNVQGNSFQTWNLARTASGYIYPSRFVSLQPDGTFIQSTTDTVPFAISFESPISAIGVYAASPGDTLKTYGILQECWLMCGGDVFAGNYLSSDDDGRGIRGTHRQGAYYALALQDGVAGQLIRVRIYKTINLTTSCEYTPEYTDEYTRCDT
jgi:hypothetical protein